jgi:hypothetical protein
MTDTDNKSLVPSGTQLIPDGLIRPSLSAANAARVRDLAKKRAYMEKHQGEHINHAYPVYRLVHDTDQPSKVTYVVRDPSGQVVDINTEGRGEKSLDEDGQPIMSAPSHFEEVMEPCAENVEYHATFAEEDRMRDAALAALCPDCTALDQLPDYLRKSAGRLVADVRRAMTEFKDDVWAAIPDVRYPARIATLRRCFDLPDLAVVAISRAINGDEQGGLAFVHELLCRAANADRWRRPWFLADDVPLIAEYLHRELAKIRQVLTAQGPRRWYVNGELLKNDWMTGPVFRGIYDKIDVMDPRTRMRAPLDNKLKRDICEAMADMHPQKPSAAGGDAATPMLPARATSSLAEFRAARLTSASWTTTRELVGAYRQFCLERGLPPVSDKALCTWLIDESGLPNVRRERGTIAEGRRHGYAGVGLRANR